MTENKAASVVACGDCARCWGEFGEQVMSLLVTTSLGESWLDRYHAEGHDLEGVRAALI
jgi:hypothetical protein